MKLLFRYLLLFPIACQILHAEDPAVKSAPVPDITRQSFPRKDFRGNGTVTGKFFQVRMDDANFEGVNFKHAKFEQCYMVGANLKGAKFAHNTKFYLVMLNKANLEGVDFKHVKLDTVNFCRANLRGAKNITSMRRLSFLKADLRGADLSQVKMPLDEVVLNGALYDNKTKFPAGLNPVTAGAKLVK